MLFREHRGLLCNSMETVVEVNTFNDLVEHIKHLLSYYYIEVDAKYISLRYQCYDDRIGWDTYIVYLEGYGVIGQTNGAF